MFNFAITTDNMADLPDEYLKENDIEIMSLSYMMDGITYNENNPLDEKLFYDKMRAGSMPLSAMVTPEQAEAVFERVFEKGYDKIVHLAFSSGLSGTASSAYTAQKNLNEKYPDKKIYFIDTLSASLGEGLLVYNAVLLRKEGKSAKECYEWINSHIQNLCHIFTVDDLFHLNRGGRVSKAAAVIGSALNIKPVLHVDEKGYLVPIDKVRGRKKAIKELFNRMCEKIDDFSPMADTFFISHGDCLDDALYLAEMIEEKAGIKRGIINYVGPAIGTHSGPGTLALFFFGSKR